MGTVVILPTYNEAGNLQGIIAEVLSVASVDVLVVDDNSPDGTGRIADSIAVDDPRVHVLHRPGKAGLGTAYLAGFEWALTHGYERIVEMDADGSHRASQLPALLEASAEGADLVIGSRWVTGGEVVNFPFRRRALSRLGNTYARHMLGSSVRDLTGGFRVFSAAALQGIGLHEVTSQGYCFQVDLARRVLAADGLVVEVPISFAERRSGTSKMSWPIVAEALLAVTRWGLTRIFKK